MNYLSIFIYICQCSRITKTKLLNVSHKFSFYFLKAGIRNPYPQYMRWCGTCTDSDKLNFLISIGLRWPPRLPAAVLLVWTGRVSNFSKKQFQDDENIILKKYICFITHCTFLSGYTTGLRFFVIFRIKTSNAVEGVRWEGWGGGGGLTPHVWN